MKKTSAAWAIAITGLALFMASLDNLVVTTALPVIRVRLHAGLSGLEWTVNAYTLTFAVLLLSAAAIGERFGRRRIFIMGIAVFTAASAVAALAPSIGVLVVARAIQGRRRRDGDAPVADPPQCSRLPERRNAALGIWGAIGGAAVAIGPLVGGAITTGWAWQYIFWLNVPIGIVLIVLAWWRLVGVPRQGVLDSTSAGCCPGQCRTVRPGLRPGPGQLARLDQYRSARRRSSVGVAGLAAFVMVGAADRRPDAAPPPVPQPRASRR